MMTQKVTNPALAPNVVVAISSPDPTMDANRCRPCGRGVYLMRQLMDEVHFNERGNSVTLILRAGAGGLGGARA